MDDDTNRSFPSAIGDTPSSSDEDDNNSSILENEKLIMTEDRLKALKEEMNKMENEHQQTLKENVMELEEKLKKETYKSREYHHEIKRLRLQNEELLEQLNNLQKQIGVDLTPSLQYPPDIDNEYEYVEFPIITVSYSENINNNNNQTFSFNDTHNNLSTSMFYTNYKRNNQPQQQQLQQSFANLKDTYNEMMSSLSQTFNDNEESITSFLTSFDDLMKAKSNNDKLVKEYKDMSLFYTYVNSKQSVIPNVIKDNDEENDSEIKQKKNDLIFAIKQLKSLLTDPPVIKKRINNLVKKNQNMLIKLEQLSQSLSTILPPKKENQNEISELEYIHNCLLKLVEGKYNDKIDINSLDKVINEVIDQNNNNNNNPPPELLEHLSKLESLQNEAKEEKIECERLYGKYVNNTLEEDNLNLEDQKNKLKDENDKLQLQTENPELEPIQKLQLEKEELLSSEELSKYPDLNNQLNNIMKNTKNHDELLDEINELKQTIKDYRRQIEDFENEKQKYLNTLNIKDPESAQTLLKDLENEIKNLKEIKEGGDPNKMIENMNKEIDNKNIEILKLKDEIEKLKEILQGINNIVNDLTTASNTHDELYSKRNELLSSLSDGKDGEEAAEDEINKIKQLIEEKNNIASILDSSLAERNKGKQQIDFLNRFFSLLDESTNILVYEETKLRDRMIDLNTTSSFIIDSINIDKFLNNDENNNEKVFNRLKGEILRINIENKKLLCYINYELKYKEYQKLLEERDQLIQDKSKLELELASGSNSNDALIVSDETYLDRLKQSLEVLSTSDDERGKKLAEFYKTKYDILEERLKTAKEKVETLTAEMNNQTMDVTNLTQENEMLKKKCEKLSSKVEKLNNGLMKLMAAKTVNES